MLIQNIFSECSVKKSFLEISQNVQENTCARVFFLMKLQTSPCNLFTEHLWATVSMYERDTLERINNIQRKNLILQ